MTQLKRSLIVTALAAVVALLGMGAVAPFTARASEEGRRNTTIGLGAATAYFAAKKQWLPAAALGVGTYYAHHNWQAQIDARHRQQNQLSYRHAYRLGLAHAKHTRVAHVAHRGRHTTRHHRA